MSWAQPVVLGLLIGLVLGGLGGGGAILTVPALVYVVGLPVSEATTGSLAIVGAAAFVGMLSYAPAGRVAWRTGVGLSLVGFPAAWAGSWLNRRVDQDAVLLGFSVLLVLAALAMLRRNPGVGGSEPPPGPGSSSSVLDTGVATRASSRTVRGSASFTGVVSVALAVGFLTGFFGVGGGFVIVPALVLVLRMPMELAVGTSLLVVTLNSATSLAARIGNVHLDLALIGPLAAAAMVGTLVGKGVADRLPGRRLRDVFAGLLVLLAVYTAVQSVLGLAG
ncbi:sulfite exporter TauE/SafE family protein [Nocardioides hungaricus]